MLDPEIRKTIICLHNKGKSKREISVILKISRNTIKKVLRYGLDVPQKKIDNQNREIILIVTELFSRCLGNAVRIHEILKDEYKVDIAYSTLTKLIYDANLRKPVKRFGEYVFDPGAEMQHDTSPHNILVGEQKIKAQCASLIFGYSRMIYVQYYQCFTRFEAKTFLKAALEFW
jgi:transposase